MRVLIIGCGYVGLPLGAALAKDGHEVTGVRRTLAAAEPLAAAGIKAVAADVTQPETLPRITGPFDWVVNTVSSSLGAASEYRQVYWEGTRNLLAWLRPRPPRKYLYTSSTGVYGQSDGSQVKETSPAEPVVETSRILVETEKLLLAPGEPLKIPAVVLRVAGIYGPDRGHYLKQYLRNEARIPGRGERWMNMIHVDDLVGIILAALKHGRGGEIYNAVDDEPVMMIHFFRWLSETLGKWMPPFAPEEAEEDRKRGLTSKKVLNRKLKMELGYRFKYPTFRQGYTAEIQRLQDAGLLTIEPEPR